MNNGIDTPNAGLEGLLPCPFCGNDDVMNDEGCFKSGKYWEVRCGNPSCFAHECARTSRGEVIAAWNTRAATVPQSVSGQARSKADQEWDEWSAVLRRMIGDRTHKLHFAADVQAVDDGVRLDNCRFIYAKPDGYIHMGQYIERCHADDRHAGWQPVWTSRPTPTIPQPGAEGEDAILRDCLTQLASALGCEPDLDAMLHQIDFLNGDTKPHASGIPESGSTCANTPQPSPIRQGNPAIPTSIRKLVLAVQSEYCSPATESEEPDDSKVSYPEETCNITFGMIRLAVSDMGDAAIDTALASRRELGGVSGEVK